MRTIFVALAATLTIGFAHAVHPSDARWGRVEFFIPNASLTTAAFTPVSVTVAALHTFNPPELVRLNVAGNKITAHFYTEYKQEDFSAGGPLKSRIELNLPGLPPGSYELILSNSLETPVSGSMQQIESKTTFLVTGTVASLPVTHMAFMKSVVSGPPNAAGLTPYAIRPKYYLALGDTEVKALLDLNAPVNLSPTVDVEWIIAESPFRTWPATGDAPALAAPVCRFFHPQVVTHFYSAKAGECALLAASSAWINEGTAFRALLPVDGVCMAGTSPVYRLFSQALANHRYTQSIGTYQALQFKGWAPEGVAFCSPMQ